MEMKNPWREQSKVNPQRENGRREINNLCFQALIAARLSGAIYQIVLTVIDRTWGFNKQGSPISWTYFGEATGLSRQSVWLAIKKAEKLCLIVVERCGTKTGQYMFNKFYDTWKIPGKHWETWLASQLNHTSKDKLLVNQITLDKSTKSHQTSKLTMPSCEPTKENLKENLKEIYVVIFNLWNELRIITHKKLTSDMKRAIDNARKDYSQEEIEQAMRNYALIVKGAEYYFDHRWTLAEFLTRRHSNNIERFLDLEVAKANFRKGDKGGTYRAGLEKLKLPNQYKDPEQHLRDYHQGQ